MAEYLDEVQGNEEIKIAFKDLEKGELYPILSLEWTETVIDNKKIKGLKALVDQGSFRYFTYMPKTFVKTNPKTIDAINSAGKTEDKWNLCNYGAVGMQSIGRFHQPGEGVNEKLLQDVANPLRPVKSPLKRAGSEDLSSSPLKKPSSSDV